MSLVGTGEDGNTRRRSHMEQIHNLLAEDKDYKEEVTNGISSFDCKATRLTHVTAVNVSNFDNFHQDWSITNAPLPSLLGKLGAKRNSYPVKMRTLILVNLRDIGESFGRLKLKGKTACNMRIAPCTCTMVLFFPPVQVLKNYLVGSIAHDAGG